MVFELKCTACGETGDVCEKVMLLQRDDGSVEYLPHPGESNWIQKFGYTMEQAGSEARLGWATFSICKRCGGLYEARKRIEARGDGCCLAMCLVVAPLLFVFSAWLFHRWGDWDNIIGVLMPAFFGVLMVWEACVEPWQLRRRHRKNLALRPPLEDKPCCATKLPESRVSLSDAAKGDFHFLCRQCGRWAVRVKFAGIS